MLASADILVPFSRCSSWRYADQVDLLPLRVKVRGFEVSAAWQPRLQPDPAHEWLREPVRRRTAHGRAGTKDPGTARDVTNVGLGLRVIGTVERLTFEWRMKAPVDGRKWVDGDLRRWHTVAFRRHGPKAFCSGPTACATIVVC